MKKNIFTFCVLFCASLLSTQTFARRVYVKLYTDDTAWTNVISDDEHLVITLPEGSTDFVGNILPQLQDGDEVWVAKGTYENTATLVLDLNINLYGGFAGTETGTADRATADLDGNGLTESWEFVNETKFKGHGNSADTPSQFQLIQLIQGTLLDGVTLSDNYLTKTSAAGGEVKDNALIRNCIIRNVTSKATGNINGGGLYVTGGGVENCLFETCTVDATGNAFGGALLIYGIKDNTPGTPTGYIKNSVIRNCSAINGSKSQGGAIFAKGGAIIENCVLYNNFAGTSGGAIFLHNNGDSNKHVNRIIGCTIANNKSNNAVIFDCDYVELYNTVVWGNETANNNYSNNLRFRKDNANVTAYPFADGVAFHGTLQAASSGLTTIEEVQKNQDVMSVLLTGAIQDEAEDTNNPLFTRSTTFAGTATTDEQLNEMRKASWTLQMNSPLIDAGANTPTNKLEGYDNASLVLTAFAANDLMGEPRNGKFDIGAYEYAAEGPGTGLDLPTARPFAVFASNGTVTVSRLESQADISIYHLNGTLLHTARTNETSLVIPLSEKGSYLLSIKMNDKAYCEKIIM